MFTFLFSFIIFSSPFFYFLLVLFIFSSLFLSVFLRFLFSTIFTSSFIPSILFLLPSFVLIFLLYVSFFIFPFPLPFTLLHANHHISVINLTCCDRGVRGSNADNDRAIFIIF
jgi:hypothetical protein